MLKAQNLEDTTPGGHPWENSTISRLYGMKTVFDTVANATWRSTCLHGDWRSALPDPGAGGASMGSSAKDKEGRPPLLGCKELGKVDPRWEKTAEGYWRDVYTVYIHDRLVAVKVLKDKHPVDQKNKERHEREVAALNLVQDSPHVVNLAGWCRTTVATDWLPLKLDQVVFLPTNQSLSSTGGKAQQAHPPMPMKRVLSVARDIALAIQALHEAPYGPIVHADIHTKQFFVDYSGKIVLSDLNRSRFTRRNFYRQPCPFLIWVSRGRWRSPEEYLGLPLTEKVDIYSMGMVIWSVLSRQRPFDEFTEKEAIQQVLKGKRPRVDPAWPGEIVSIIQACWAQNPEDRPAVQDVVSWLTTLLEKDYRLVQDTFEFDFTLSTQQA